MIRLFVALGWLVLLASGAAGASRESEIDGLLTGEGFTSLALRIAGEGHLEIDGPVTVNERRARFLVDTGAQVTVLDRAGVKRFGVTPQRTTVMLYGALGGRGEKLGAGLAASFRIGPADMRPFLFAVTGGTGLSGVWDRSSPTIDGVVGVDVLRLYQWIIDCRGMRLFVRIDDPKSASRSSLGSTLRRLGYSEIPLQRSSYSEFEFRAKVNDTTVLFLLDTGADVSIIDRTLARLAGIPVESSDFTIKGTGRAQRSLLQGRAESFRAGSYRTGPFKISVADLTALNRQLQEQNLVSLGGYLGTDFLREKDAIIDCANLKLYLRN